MTKIEDDQKGRLPKWKMTKIKEDKNVTPRTFCDQSHHQSLFKTKVGRSCYDSKKLAKHYLQLTGLCIMLTDTGYPKGLSLIDALS